MGTASRCHPDTNRRRPLVDCTDLGLMLESFRFPTSRSMATCGRKVPGCSKPRWMTVCPQEDPGLRLRGREEGGLQADGGKREATVQCVPALYTLLACDWSSRRHVITILVSLLVYYVLCYLPCKPMIMTIQIILESRRVHNLLTVQCVPALYTLLASHWSSRRHVITNPSILLVYYALVISTMYAYDYDNTDHPRVSPRPQVIAKLR